MSSKSIAGGRGVDRIYSTISSRQAALLNLSSGTDSQSPVASTLAHRVSNARRLLTEEQAAHEGDGSLAAAATSWGSSTSWNASASPIHSSSPATIATAMASTPASPAVEYSRFPSMTATPGENVNPFPLPSTIFVSPEQIHVVLVKDFTTSTTSSQGNAVDASLCSVSIEGLVTISTNNNNSLLTECNYQPQGHYPIGTMEMLSFPQPQAAVLSTTYKKPQCTDRNVVTTTSQTDRKDDHGQEECPFKAPRRRMTRASTGSPVDMNDKDAIRKFKNNLAQKKCRRRQEMRIKELQEETNELSRKILEKEGYRDELRANVDRQQKEIERHRKVAWICSTGLGILLFLCEIALLCWVKFFKSKNAAIASTVIVIPAGILFITFSLIFYRKLVAHKYERHNEAFRELESLAANVQNSNTQSHVVHNV